VGQTTNGIDLEPEMDRRCSSTIKRDKINENNQTIQKPYF